MSVGSRVAKNAAWLMGATTLTKLVAFVTFVVIARLVGPSVTGTFFYSVSITSVCVVLADIGMTPVVIRAIAGGRQDATTLLAATIRLKTLLVPVAILISVVYGAINQADRQTLITIAVACLVMTADTFHLVLYGALRGKQNLRPEAIGMFVGQLLTAGVSILAAFLTRSPIGLAIGLLTGSVWNVVWARRKTRLAEVELSIAATLPYRALLIEALPFTIAGIAVKLYSYVDSLLIQAYHGAVAVGLYAVAHKMTYALQFLPLTFTAALYPALAAAWSKQDHSSLRQTFLGSMRLMAAISFPMSAALSALAAPIILSVYGNHYAGAIPAFRVLPWVLLPIFLDFPVGSLLNASHRAHLKTTAMVGTMIVNIVANLFLVPSLGPLGAAWSGVCSFWVLFFIGLIFARKDAGGWTVLGSLLLRASVAAAASWWMWEWLNGRIPFVLVCLFGGVFALGLAFLLKLITLEDARWVKGFLRRRSKLSPEEGYAET